MVELEGSESDLPSVRRAHRSGPTAPTLLAALSGGLALAATACGGKPGSGAVTVRDSADVRIVESPRSLVDRPSAWKVAPEPDVVIGATEGDSSDMLFGVSGAAQLDDGRILVVNGGTQELRFYDGRGRFLTSVGGEGDGPGEYRVPRLVAVTSGDTIVVSDLRSGRFTVLDGRGRHVRSATPARFVGLPVGRLSGGRFVTSLGSACAGPDTPEGELPDTVRFLAVDARAGVLDTVAVTPGAPAYVWREGATVGFLRVPLTTDPSGAVAGDLVYVALTRAPEIRTYRADGRLVRIARVRGGLPRVRRSEFDAAVRRRVAKGRDGATDDGLRRAYQRMSPPSTRSLFDRILVDRLGDVWARRLPTDDGGGPRRWAVFEGGRPLGSVETPAGLHVEEIGEGYLLGVARGRLGVQRVERYRLVR